MVEPLVQAELAALDTLFAVPTCVSVVIRREVAEQLWDITIRRVEHRERLSGESNFTWECHEPYFTKERGEPPREVLSSEILTTPEAAFVAAAAYLAWTSEFDATMKSPE